MNDSLETPKSEPMEAILSLAAQRVQPPQRGLVDGFGREYFRRMDADDLRARSAEDLLGALLTHWQFGARRRSGQTLVHVFNPAVAENGWASRHTVIDIVNDDMPFLVDSASMEIHRQGLTLHLIVHPIFAVERDPTGALHAVRPRSEVAGAAPGRHESWIHIEVDRIVDPQRRADLAAGLQRVFADVRAAVSDWKPMLAQLQTAIAELQAAPASLPAAQVQESLAFLQWLADDHMTFLGYRRHDLVTEQGVDALRLVPGSGLGLLRESEQVPLSASFLGVAGQRARNGALARAVAADHEGQYALQRAPAGLHRLCGHQALQHGG